MKQVLGFFCSLALILVSVSLSALPSLAGETAWQNADMARARLVGAQSTTGGQKEVMLGLQIQLDRGWKTYWRSPGDSGLPPTFDWSGSENLESATILWPRPVPFDSFGLLTWGYKEEILFPVRVKLKNPNEPLRAQLHVNYGVCEVVCVPLQQDFQLVMSSEDAANSPYANLISVFQQEVPMQLGSQDKIQKIKLVSADGDTLVATIETTGFFDAPMMILEGQPGDFFEVKKTEIAKDRKSVAFTIKADLANRSDNLAGLQVVATIMDHGMAIEDELVIGQDVSQ